MKKFILLIILLIITTAVFSQKDKNKIEAAIVGFFNGLSLTNVDTLKYHTTSDFHLIEDGEIWNMDTLVSKVMAPGRNKITRINKFEFIKMEERGSMAWVSYHNTAVFSLGEKQQTVNWMESAVLLKIEGRWQIQMLHSTPLK